MIMRWHVHITENNTNKKHQQRGITGAFLMPLPKGYTIALTINTRVRNVYGYILRSRL